MSNINRGQKMLKGVDAKFSVVPMLAFADCAEGPALQSVEAPAAISAGDERFVFGEPTHRAPKTPS